MRRREKNSEEIKVWLNETLKRDLSDIAFMQGFDSLSPFIRKILSEYVYGHGEHFKRQMHLLAGTLKDE